jgi:hypothetical protein
MSLMHIKTACLLAAVALLTACGGGGGSGNSSGFNPPGFNASASAQATSIPSGSTTDISVRITEPNGTPIRDGVVVSASVNPSSVGTIVGITAGGATQSPTSPTVAGNANFRFTGDAPGTATVTFSATDPNAPARTISTSITITVTQGQPRLSIQPERTTLPINAFNVDPFLGSPYMTEVTIIVRDATGNPVNLPDGVQVSVNPVGATGGFTTLDDPETTDINEFLQRMGQAPVDVVAGRATIFLHSLNFSGTTTLTVSHTGADGRTFEATQVFTIVSTLPRLPAQVIVNPPNLPLYVVDSGGNSSAQIELIVLDGTSQPVPDPVAGNAAFNNVRVEILGDALGARLTGINAAGQSVSGTSIVVRTFNGISGVSLSGATRPGQILLRATSDRADNNVDNGISDPVFGQRSLVISDGVLFDLQITNPFVNALFVNPVDPDVDVDVDDNGIPREPDGTYSLTISAIATDRQGNPVLPGTVINFGLIDEPQEIGLGDFLISGNDGRPQVGGINFTAPGGQFMTAGGGAGPGDTLVVFGKRESQLPFGLTPPPHGYRDLESARLVARINSQTSLDVTRRFNFNDDTGVSVPVPAPGLLPYVIGRATDGNITASGVTDERGVVSVQMNYPVSRLGKVVVIWAQGNGDIVAGSPETVTDAQTMQFYGLAPAELFVSPSQIPANTSAIVQACVLDAARSPISGVRISASFADFQGTGSITFLGSGPMPNLTGANGCVNARITTAGVGEGNPRVVFSGAGDTAEVQILRGTLVLQAVPSVIFGSSTVTLTLLDAGGVPQPGYQITGSCTATAPTTLTITAGPGVTNAAGQTTVSISATELNRIGSAGSGQCVFQTVDGSATATVVAQGIDVCTLGTSPRPPGCPGVAPVTFTVNLSGTLAASGSSSPAGIACPKAAGVNVQCNAQFDVGTTVTLVVRPSDDNPASVVFSGDCVRAADTATSAQATVTMSTARTCNVAVN